MTKNRPEMGLERLVEFSTMSDGSTQGEPEWAARLWGAAQALRAAIGAPLPLVYRTDYERALTNARIRLGEEAFARARAEGEAMTVEQTLDALPLLFSQLDKEFVNH